MLPTPLQALDAPMQWIYWFVTVASTVQVPARALEMTMQTDKNRKLEIVLCFIGNKKISLKKKSVIQLGSPEIASQPAVDHPSIQLNAR
jgi:hypothetical protein